MRLRLPAAVAAAVLGVAGMSACSSSAPTSSGRSGSSAAPSGSSDAAASNSASTSPTTPPAAVTIDADVADTGRIAPSAPINLKVTGGTLRSVSVTAPSGKAATGQLDTGAGTWTPSAPLALGTSYVVSVTAANTAGDLSTTRRTLTTSAVASSVNQIVAASPGDGAYVGNGQPVVVEFAHPVTNKDAVTKALKVTDSSHVEGAWRWISPRRVDYRPKTYWPVGDHVSFSSDLTGVQTGSAAWGAGTTGSGFTVNSDLRVVVDPAHFTSTVYEGGKAIRTMKIDTAKPGLTTPTGTMVVLEKNKSVLMTSCSVGIACNKNSKDYYSEQVGYAARVTWSGIYLHAAPWDHQLGQVNSSHGCIHLSQADAEWFFAKAEPGNVVTVTGTVDPVSIGNGDGDWNLSWAQWTAPSA